MKTPIKASKTYENNDFLAFLTIENIKEKRDFSYSILLRKLENLRNKHKPKLVSNTIGFMITPTIEYLRNNKSVSDTKKDIRNRYNNYEYNYLSLILTKFNYTEYVKGKELERKRKIVVSRIGEKNKNALSVNRNLTKTLTKRLDLKLNEMEEHYKNLARIFLNDLSEVSYL